jgi:23S rRNA pseudouridine955/2504/2580 synthase
VHFVANPGILPQEVQFIQVSEDQAGQRIDNFLLARLKGVPKSRIYRLLRKGEVRVNKGRIKPEYRLETDDLIRIPPIRVSAAKEVPVPGAALRGHLEESILFENDELLVISKPPGMAVHGGSGVKLGLIEALRASRGHDSLELVHRLDRGTSGCLLVAKKRSALKNLQDQLRQHQTRKTYLALVDGRWPKGLDVMDAPLQKRTTASGERIVRASAEGKVAVSRFRVRERFANATLIEVDIETGRTHQIRVHCQLAGHPLLGDDKYGGDQRNSEFRQYGLKRLFLHASRLCFCMPASGEDRCVEAPLPGDLEAVLEKLRG